MDQLVGRCGQALGRGLIPRFSTGTLQLSIRCSSIHFRPRRSFPVSVRGEVAEIASVGGAFCATVGTASKMPNNQASDALHKNRMNGLAKSLKAERVGT